VSRPGDVRWTGAVNERPTISDAARVASELVKHPGGSIAFWERRHGSFGENMTFPS
jgi:hypothetical protein